MKNRVTEVCITILTLSLVFFMPLVRAQVEDPEPPVINIDIDVQGIIDAITGMANGLGTTVSSVPSQVFNIFTDSFKNSVKNFDSPVLDLTLFLLSANPNPDSMHNWWQSIVLIISSFYLLLFLIIGFMFLFSSIDPEKRITAKEWLKNAFIMIIGINISFVFYKLLLQLSTAITQFMWMNGFDQFFEQNLISESGAVLLVFFTGATMLTLITLFIRYVFLLIAVMLFPIGLFLYFVPPLQNWGKIIFNLIGVALFMQFFDVIIFIASNQVALDLAGQEAAAIVPALSFLLVGILNVLLIFYAVLKAAFSIQENSRVLTVAFSAISGQITALISAIKPIPK